MTLMLRQAVTGLPGECSLTQGIKRPVSATPANEAAAAAGLAKGEDEEDEDLPQTLLEHVEEVLLGLAGSDQQSFVAIAMLTQKAQKRNL